jgi:hypothetical protein
MLQNQPLIRYNVTMAYLRSFGRQGRHPVVLGTDTFYVTSFFRVEVCRVRNWHVYIGTLLGRWSPGPTGESKEMEPRPSGNSG